MKIFNGTKSRLVFKLDNGEMLTVRANEFSSAFIATKVIVASVMKAGSNQQLGIVASSSLELKIINEVPAAYNYLYGSERECLAALSKNYDDSSEDQKPAHEGNAQGVSTDTALLKLQEELKSMKAELQKEHDMNAELKKKIETSKAQKAVEELTEKNKEIIQLKNEKSELKTQIDSLNSDLDEVQKLKEKSDSELKTVQLNLADAQNKISDATKQFEELKKSVDTLKKENEQLKSDGKLLMDKFEKAKQSVTDICDKFNIEYLDGEWVLSSADETADDGKTPDAPDDAEDETDQKEGK